jgi:sigma-B regulation protein RsbU (phosphoserine phosphatase)
VTLLVARLDPRGRTLAYASAGHVSGYLLDEAGETRERFGSTGIPLGMFPRREFRSGTTLSLKLGETVVLFSDGMTEIGELDGEAFGAARTLEFVKNHRHESAADIVQGLYKAARSFAGKFPQTDDITVVICKVEAAP